MIEKLKIKAIYDDFLQNIHLTEEQIKILNMLINKDSMVFGGKFNDYIKNYLSAKNIKFIDYFEIDAFQIQNALLTAEGAIYYVKDKLERSISSLNIAIFGFGRISKILAYLLHSQGAKISIYARKESDIAWCKLIGLNAVKIEIGGNKTARPANRSNFVASCDKVR